MGTLFRQFIQRWLKNQFRGNPLVEQPGPYLQKVGQAVSVGFMGGLILVGVALLGFIIFMVGVLRGWF